MHRGDKQRTHGVLNSGRIPNSQHLSHVINSRHTVDTRVGVINSGNMPRKKADMWMISRKPTRLVKTADTESGIEEMVVPPGNVVDVLHVD